MNINDSKKQLTDHSTPFWEMQITNWDLATGRLGPRPNLGFILNDFGTPGRQTEVVWGNGKAWAHNHRKSYMQTPFAMEARKGGFLHQCFRLLCPT